jgi:hypothetical protein
MKLIVPFIGPGEWKWMFLNPPLRLENLNSGGVH